MFALIRIYGYFRPDWEETPVISEAMKFLRHWNLKHVDDFVDETREDVKDKLKEFDENMSEHEWYRKNRIAIFIAGAFALFFALAVTQVNNQVDYLNLPRELGRPNNQVVYDDLYSEEN